MNEIDYKELYSEAKATPEYWATGLMTDYAVALEDCIEKSGLNKREFAAKAVVKPSYLTRVLNAYTNITALTMAKLALAAGMEVRLSLRKIGSANSNKNNYGPEVKVLSIYHSDSKSPASNDAVYGDAVPNRTIRKIS